MSRGWRDGPLTVQKLEELYKTCAREHLWTRAEEAQYDAWLRARSWELWGQWGREDPRSGGTGWAPSVRAVPLSPSG